MGPDASIYSLIRPIAQGPGPLDQYTQAMQLKNLMSQEGLQDIQRRGMLRDEETGQKLRDLFSRNPSPADAEVMAIDPMKAGPAYLKQKREGLKADADLQKVDRENFIALADQSRKALSTVTPQNWAQYRDGMIQAAGMFKTPEIRAAAMRAAEAMPAQFDPTYVRNSLVKAEELFTPKPTERTDGQRKWFEDTNPFTNPGILSGRATQMQQTPGEKATDARGWATIAETRRNNERPVYDQDRGGFATRPQPGVTPTFIPASGAPKSQREIVATREDTDNLRKEFEAKESVKRYRDVLPVAASAAKAPDTRSGDIQMAYAVGKILDPASVVREGELKLVGDAATVMGKIEGELRTLTQGKGRLTPETRAALNAMLGNAVAERKASFDAEQNSYRGIVERRGYKPEDVFVDVPADRRAPTTPTPAAPPPKPKLGEKRGGYTYRGGDPANPNSWAK